MYKLLAVDMDGTLLNSRLMVSPYTTTLLQEAERRGVRIVICTGRAHVSAQFYSRELKLSAYVVSANGALALDPEGQPLFMSPLDIDVVSQVLDVLHRYQIAFEAFTPRAVISDAKPKRPTLLKTLGWSAFLQPRALSLWIRHWRVYGLYLVPDALDYLRANGPCIKVFCPERIPGTAAQAADEIRALGLDVEISSSGSDNFEVNAPGVNKGTGLARLAAMLGIDRSEVIAVGDHLNDLEMVRWAGLGVAMGNASPALKEAADAVTGTNDEDGVGKVIEEFILARRQA